MDFPGHIVDDIIIMDHSCSSEEDNFEEEKYGEGEDGEHEEAEDDEYGKAEVYFENSYSNVYYQCSNEKYICDTCEREFNTHWQYQKHMSEHRTCNIDGCTFTAHEKVVEKHIRMQHSSGLYDKIKNLITPEDIAKWIADRKKKYPSKENVEKRYRQQEEMLKRGEKLKANANRFDKNNKTRFSLNRQNHTYKRLHNKKVFSRHRTAKRQHQMKLTTLIDDKSDWNGNLFPFEGTSQLYEENEIEDSSNFDDTEWIEENSSKTPKKIVLKNALETLMSAYNSDNDSEIEDIVPKSEITTLKDELVVQSSQGTTEIISLAVDRKTKEVGSVTLNDDKDTCQQEKKETETLILSDDEAPLEQKIERVEVSSLNESLLDQQVSAHSSNDNKQTHKRKRTHRKGPYNSRQQKHNKKFHTSPQNKSQNRHVERSKDVYRKRQVTLLERLLANEIIHERNVLLQCVRYVVASGFFDTKVCDSYDEVI